MSKKTLSATEGKELLGMLKARFAKSMHLHKGIDWAAVEAKLAASPGKLWSLSEMERTGGEPDVIGVDKKSGEFVFCDCSAESPKGRRSLCYDRAALDSRKENKPAGSAMEMAEAMGIALLTEEEYVALQGLAAFDLKTSSWLATPGEVRKLGGAIFGDCRYGRIFVYHNGAESYYAARGWRGVVRV